MVLTVVSYNLTIILITPAAATDYRGTGIAVFIVISNCAIVTLYISGTLIPAVLRCSYFVDTLQIADEPEHLLQRIF